MADVATPPDQTPPHHEPIEAIHFNETYSRPVHHYFIWAAIAIVVLGGGWYSFRDKFSPKPQAESAVPLPPKSLDLDLQSTAEGVSFGNKMNIAMVEAKATVTTFSGAHYFITLSKIEPGATTQLKWDQFRNVSGWPLDLKKESPVTLTIESFGMKAEKSLLAAAPAESTPAK